MIGAYYEAQPLDPIGALGEVSSQASLAHEAIRPLLMGTLGQFAPWAEQTTEAFQKLDPEVNYNLFPINAATLTEAERRALGSPVGMVGMIFRAPMPLDSADALLSQGPYDLARAEVLYRLDDEKPTPTPFFFYIGTLMDEGDHDGQGTYQKLEGAVRERGGTLVFIVPTARTGDERAAPDAAASIASPLQPGQEFDPTVSAESIAPQASASPAASGTVRQTLVGALGLVGGVFVGYKIFRRRRAAP